MTNNPITAWSYSRLQLYEECPAKFKYRHIDKLPEVAHPAMERGKNIHKDAERFLTGEDVYKAPTLLSFGLMFDELRAFEPMVEQQWGFTRDWRSTGWFAKDCWVRVVLDACVVYEGDEEALVIDFKTGKKYDDNADQIDLFKLATFKRFPGVRTVDTRLWYLDSGEETQHVFDKKGLAGEVKAWEDRVEPMFRDTEFRPRPTKKCNWCSFSRQRGGPCKY